MLIMDDYNKEKYRVCLDEYQDEDGECYAYSLELSKTDGIDGFGVDTIKYAKTEGEDLDDNWGIEIIELKYFNDLEEANKSFAEYCEDYVLIVK